MSREQHSAEVVRYIGASATEIDSLAELSRQLSLHPQASHFEIRRGSGWGALEVLFRADGDRCWTTYDRRRTHLQDFVLDGNCNGEWGGVSEAVVQRAAQNHLGVADLGRYGCRSLCP